MTSGRYSRRTFLEAMGTSIPTLRLMLAGDMSARTRRAGTPAQTPSPKFTPVDLTGFFTASATDFGPRERAWSLPGESALDGLIRTPGGERTFRGIPFLLGPANVGRKAWIVLSTAERSWAPPLVEIPFRGRAGFVCLAHFCDWDDRETPEPGMDAAERVGQHLADLVFAYEDGEEAVVPIRRRFEVNSPSVFWGHDPFAALPHRERVSRALDDPLAEGTAWGSLQTGVGVEWQDEPYGNLWICSLPNPSPERPLSALRFRAASEDPLVVCGLSVFQGRESPLRYERLTLYRVTLPEDEGESEEEIERRWDVDVDLGVVARRFVLGDFDPEAWLAGPDKGLGRRDRDAPGPRCLYVEVAASREAILYLRDVRTGRSYQFELGRVVPGRELEPRESGPSIRVLEPEKIWVRGRVEDPDTGAPTPVRLAFRSKEGRYIPPYGHRSEVNSAWFQDHGADLKLYDSSFAYVDGTFQVELPVGEVYLEVTKGFEHEAIRRKLEIQPEQRELRLQIPRFTSMRAEGWVSADVHVHFLSPSTAVLEGQAEGLNLINLLAAQWGDLFTNVGDIPQESLASRDGETIVRVGTENRQHILGHIGLLGGHGEPVFPLSAAGPPESYLGDPLWSSLAEWADACRRRDGVSVAVHFPYPTAELPADIVLGKIDAVELYSYGQYFNSLPYLDWYRYLNCGYRLAAVGGTDRMGAYIAVGANRTYAYLGREEFTFENWARAVRKGNTFQTSGPLLLLQVDGHPPGAEITLGTGGGTLEVQVEARSFLPFHQVEVVLNGRVVAAREAPEGTREMFLREHVRVPGPGWLAARCISRTGVTTEWPSEIAGTDPPSISAHTSPVYVVVPGEELFSALAATYMLTLIDGAQTYVETLATRADAKSFGRIRKVFEDARAHLHRRLHELGTDH